MLRRGQQYLRDRAGLPAETAAGRGGAGFPRRARRLHAGRPDGVAGDRAHSRSPARRSITAGVSPAWRPPGVSRSEEHTSELQSLMRISYAVFCLKKKKKKTQTDQIKQTKCCINTSKKKITTQEQQ